MLISLISSALKIFHRFTSIPPPLKIFNVFLRELNNSLYIKTSKTLPVIFTATVSSQFMDSFVLFKASFHVQSLFVFAE